MFYHLAIYPERMSEKLQDVMLFTEAFSQTYFLQRIDVVHAE
jgi:hypothetical protein